MKDRIKFNDVMLKAVIDGRKTQTRRPSKPQPKVTEDGLRYLSAWQDGYTLSEQVCAAWRHGFVDVDCLYGEIGDIINIANKDGNIKGKIEITDIWLQQVQEISQQDAMKEGAPQNHASIDAVSREYGFPDFPRSWFAQTWIDIYGKDNWVSNEWVWVVEFKKVE
ncbi:TPA: ASCH domain-containing protein [Proteus mirabilis]|uniref:ASCH domain-containing protein n=1 Tax=Proteus mirabilis TaxID=584 RepID=UPI00073B551B|nr:ASCH domain-containing protein [Proteus mirabilis]KSW14228.1 PmgT domain-containing protein [Proteus mirabilis]HDU8622732.1 ASCH domain-containing protein [Proteus mirabilis]HEH1507557.1 ASCH domain-containing protein [Proteus mirabilis]HEJ9448813.1 ASCH domain-containing protein [Proteus mirabilis]HEK3165802.1 ASCH domain-containing protein [Proteus mirabilis]